MLEDQVTTHIHEIEALKQQERYPEALQKIQKLLFQFTDDYRLYEEMADIYLYEGETGKAEHAVKLAQNLHPDSATGKYLMGYIHISKNHFKKGVELLTQANELFPNNPEILRNLGWGYVMTNKEQQGICLLRRALNLSPEDFLVMEDL